MTVESHPHKLKNVLTDRRVSVTGENFAHFTPVINMADVHRPLTASGNNN